MVFHRVSHESYLLGLEDRLIEHPKWLLTWLVLILALAGRSAGANTPFYVAWASHGMRLKAKELGLYSELAQSFLPYSTTSVATEPVHIPAGEKKQALIT